MSISSGIKNEENNLVFKPEITPNTYNIAQNVLAKWLTGQGKIVILIMELIVLCMIGINFYFRYQTNQIEKNLANQYDFYMQEDNQKIIQTFQSTQSDLERIKEKVATQNNIEDYISNTAKLLPPKVELVALAYNSRAIAVRAIAPDAPTFGQFVTNLIADNKIKSVLLKKSSYDKNTDLFDFELALIY
jgi:nitrogen fixation/metabolism regulation signal transduction histidine kinase